MSAMTQNAWIFMGTVWSIVGVLTLVCFVKLLTSTQFNEPENDPKQTPPFGGPED